MRAVLLIAVFMALGSSPVEAGTSGEADTLDVRECVALARRRAPALRVAQSMERAAAGDSAETALNRRPDLSLRAGGTVAPAGFYDPVITNLGDYQVKAGLDWTLADAGARTRARVRSGLGLQSARWRVAFETRDAGLQAAQFALRLLRLGDELEARRQSLGWLDGLATLVRGGITSGLRGPADSIRVTLERDAAQAALEDAQLETRLTTLELRALLDRPGEEPLAIRAGRDLLERGPGDADSLRLAGALMRQPEVALALIEEQQRRLDLEEARRSSGPTMAMSLDAGLVGADLTSGVPAALRAENPQATFSDRLRRDLGASLTLHVRLPVLDAARPRRVGARAAALEAAGIAARAEVAAQERRALALIVEWRSAFRRLEATELTYERAERNLLKLKSLYSAGATTLLDLLDARRVFEDTRGRSADARAINRWAQFQVEDRR